MEINTHMKIYRIILLIVLATVVTSCNKKNLGGEYVCYGDKQYEMYLYLKIKPNGQFEYHHYLDWSALITSGIWEKKSDTIILNSSIQDINNFPIEINCIEKNKYQDTTLFILKNINWRYYNWYCIYGPDTVKVENDTVTFITKPGKANISLFVNSKSYTELFQLSLPVNCIAMKPHKYKSASSSVNEINTNCVYSISCDSIFGGDPLNYIILNNSVLTPKNNKILFPDSGGYVLNSNRYYVFKKCVKSAFRRIF